MQIPAAKIYFPKEDGKEFLKQIDEIDVKGHSVIMPTNTFFATPASVIHAGGEVIFAAVTENLCIDTESVKENIRDDKKIKLWINGDKIW